MPPKRVCDVAPELHRMLEPVGKIKPFERNPRRGDVARIRESLREHGQFKPIIVRRQTSEILIGNHTYLSAVEEGWTHIAVLWRDEPSDETATRIMLVDNRTSDVADYDWPEYGQLLAEIDKTTAGLAGTGFAPVEFEHLLRDHNLLDQHRGIEDPEPGRLPRNPKTKAGDVIELGDHARIMAGDSRRAADVKKLCAGETIDFIFTSPPYNVGVRYSDHDDETVSWDDYAAFLRAVVETWLPHLGKGRALGWNIGAAASIHPHRQAVLIEDAGLTYVREIVWRKMGVPLPKWHFTQKNPQARRFTPNPIHELIYVFANGALEFGDKVAVDQLGQHDVIDIHQSQATKDLKAGDVRSGSRQSEKLQTRAFKAHPAVFPVRLPALFVNHFAAAGEIVADPFAGAGTTALAAVQLDRRALLMEIDPAYVDVAVDRWEDLTGETAKRPTRRRAKKAPAKRKETRK